MLNNLKSFEQYDNDPYSEENWEEKDKKWMNNHVAWLPRVEMERLVGKTIKKIEHNFTEDQKEWIFIFEDGDRLTFTYADMEGSVLLDNDVVEDWAD